MGESIIIAPIKRWLRGMQNRTRDQQHRWSWRNLLPGRPATETAQDDQMAYIRGIFDLSDVPIETSRASGETLDGKLNQLAPDLVESVFASKALPSREAVTREREETDGSLPMARPITRVSADAPSENENADAAQGQEQAVRPISSDESEDSAHEAAEEKDDGVEPQVELSNPLEETPTPREHDTDDVLASLAGGLKDIFKSKVSTNPQTKRLIQKHGTVDAHELVNDLRDLVRSIGDIEPRG